MSQWTALNVACDGEWNSPDLSDNRANQIEHPNEGFDLLLSMFRHGEDRGEVTAMFHEIAKRCGEIECVVSVSGGDTSDCFTFNLYDGNLIERSWSNTKGLGRDVDYESDEHILDRIEDDIGRRPFFGGNHV